jgi:hypothetical protein
VSVAGGLEHARKYKPGPAENLAKVTEFFGRRLAK